MARLRLSKVTKLYRGASPPSGVVEVDIDLPSGGRLALVGPSGSGKSTILRLIAGLERCDEGQIWLGDHELTRESPSRRSVALVSQQPALYPHLTVGANLVFGLRDSNALGVFDVIRRVLNMSLGKAWRRWERSPRGGLIGRFGTEAAVREDRVWQVVLALRLESLLDRFPHQLSGGERQRVALGRALVRNPAAFLFDEPMAAIDAQHRSQIRLELLQRLRDQQATTVYVTHDFAEAVGIADWVAVVDRGKIQQFGTPEDVYRRPANLAVAEIFASRGMNLLPVRWVPIDHADRAPKQSPPCRDAWSEESWSEDSGQGEVGRLDSGHLNNGHLNIGRLESPAFEKLVGQASQVGQSRQVGESRQGRGVLIDHRLGARWDLGDLPTDVVLGVRPDDVAVTDVANGVLAAEIVAIDTVGSGASLAVSILAGAGFEGRDGSGAPVWWICGSGDRAGHFSGNGANSRGPSGIAACRIGDRVGLTFQSERLHFFGATSGRNLGKEFNETQ
jgi:ABC-type sugar transport system ATPase subunit